MGWAILLAFVILGLAACWLIGVRGGMLKAIGAALLLGASGYALQGHPDMPGAPAQASEAQNVLPLTEARHAFFGQFTAAESWLRISEALARNGKGVDAVNILQNATKRYPGVPQLWIGLGNALVDHAHGLTPPAQYAYQRAAQIVPGHPAAPFFYGLALARSGDRASAVGIWQRILDQAPANATWRPLVAKGIAALSPSNAPRAPGPGQSPPAASPPAGAP